MNNPLGFKKNTIVIEIGNDWIKICQLRFQKEKQVIDKIKLLKLASIKGAVSHLLSQEIKDFSVNKAQVNLLIPRHLATVRVLSLPSSNEQEIVDMINLQVDKQTPYSKDEIVFSHYTIKVLDNGYAKVMLVIVRRAIIQERIEELERAGIIVSKVVLGTEGIYEQVKSFLKSRQKNGVYMFLDIDSNFCDCIVLDRDKLVFSRSIFIGANHLIYADLKECERFINEVETSLDLYRKEYSYEGNLSIFLTGAVRDLSKLNGLLAQRFLVPVETIMPDGIVSFQPGIKEILCSPRVSCVSVTALTGALISTKEKMFNLTPVELQLAHLVEERRRKLTLIGILIIAIVMMVSFLFSMDIYHQTMYLSQLNQQMAKINNEAKEVEMMRERVQIIEQRLDARGTSLQLLQELYKLVPKEIYFSHISIEEKNRVILKGRGYAMSDVFAFVPILEGSPYFENVKTTHTTTRKEKDEEFAEFEITCSYQM